MTYSPAPDPGRPTCPEYCTSPADEHDQPDGEVARTWHHRGADRLVTTADGGVWTIAVSRFDVRTLNEGLVLGADEIMLDDEGFTAAKARELADAMHAAARVMEPGSGLI